MPLGKGETSGHYQYVKALSADCDNDTLLAKVEQIGAACHTGNHTCFYRQIVGNEYDSKNPLQVLNLYMQRLQTESSIRRKDLIPTICLIRGLTRF